MSLLDNFASFTLALGNYLHFGHGIDKDRFVRLTFHRLFVTVEKKSIVVDSEMPFD